MEDSARKTHPMIIVAAIAVTVASLAAIANFTGLVPAKSAPETTLTAAAPPPPPEAAPIAAPPTLAPPSLRSAARRETAARRLHTEFSPSDSHFS